ncbi:MAG: pyridoxamine 5'-phosphate oxidase family protein [Gammaproteobacteria bacterium]
MPIEYHDISRKLQDQYETRKLADRISDFAPGVFSADDRAMVESADLFFLATADAQGRPQVSYKGGYPGFVKVLDDRTLAFPIFDGNGMFLSAGNMFANPNVGLLFIDFIRPYRLRVNGTASVSDNDPLLGEFLEAQMVVRVAAREIFPNCPRYIHKMQLVERSRYVPQAACETPIAKWKLTNLVQDVLPLRDRQAINAKLKDGAAEIIEVDFEKPLRDQI